MSKLINLIMRMAMWGVFGAVLLVAVTWVIQNFFEGGVLGTGRDSEALLGAAIVGAAVGAVVGFFRRN